MSTLPNDSPPTGLARARRQPLLLVVIAVLAAIAWLVRFVQDDAFISFRYARHLAEGHGLVFNVGGEPVEGYTNFLWTLLLAIPHALGGDPIVFSQGLGLAAFAVTLWLTFRLGRALSDHPAVPWAAVAIAGTNFTFISYATGGLETMWQAMWATAAATLVAHAARTGRWSIGRCMALSLIAAAAFATRMDSAVLMTVPLWIALIAGARQARSSGQAAARIAAVVAPGALVAAAWLGWKLDYYGSILPNTFYAKAGGLAAIVRGGYYIVAFAVSYLLLPLAIAYAWSVRTQWRQWGPSRWLVINATVIAWLAYVIKVGGDFMEFRFLVPIVPLIAAALAWWLFEKIDRPRWRIVCLVALVGASAVHAATFEHSPLKRGLEAIPDLAEHLRGGNVPWSTLGETLARDLEQPESVTIAVTPAGAIPYYSRCRTIDMLGLNDRHVAHHGAHLSNRPGHQRIATVAYLLEQNVHLVIGHPNPASPAARQRGHYALADINHMFLTRGVPDPESLGPSARIVEIPVADKRCIAIYLTPHQRIDRLIESGRWRVLPLID